MGKEKNMKTAQDILDLIKQEGVAYVGEEVAAEATWMCLVGNA